MTAARRRLAWDACVNVRDLGGLRCGTGTLRSGVLVRASMIGTLSPDGLAEVHAHGIRTVIDLRWPDEVARQPSFFADGMSYRNVPVDAGLRLKLHEHALAGAMQEQIAVLAQPDSGLRDAIEAIAAAEPAIVVHCQAGRDRTGIVIALLLAAIGVTTEDIVGDYCASDVELASEYERFGVDHPEVVPVIAEHVAHRAWVVAELLKATESGYGGAAGYLAHMGVSPGSIARLRAMLVA